jgi:Ca2+-binding RTX toxin-like protein
MNPLRCSLPIHIGAKEQRGLIGLGLGLVALVVLAWPAQAASAAPSCAEGPRVVGETIVGTPCDDVIHAPPGVATVKGGAGDDTMVAAPIAASEECPAGCHLGVGSQTFEGGPGNDVVYGERGNDILNGGEGDDRLYGGIGDDRLRGGPGDDLLSGGFGADSIDGESGDDFVRGDPTIDAIADSGGGVDTLSYATGVTPGFSSKPGVYPDFSAYSNFPTTPEGRGAYIDLEAEIGDNGVAPDGGGVDEEVAGTSFEKVIGTPFSDFIVGSSNGETIYGGGGADVILGGGGSNRIYGGADGDYLEGEGTLDGGGGSDSCVGLATKELCETTGKAVVPRDPTKISAGLMAPQEGSEAELYLSGSSDADEVSAAYSPGSVTFHLGPGSAGSFDASAADAGGCDPPSSTELVCPFAGSLDSIVLAGLGGDDELSAGGFPASTSAILLGGEGADRLTGGSTEDVLVDGPGSDESFALGGDDAVLNNAGVDRVHGEAGNDLFLSNSICDGDLIDGGEGRDNSSWAKFEAAVAVRLGEGHAGEPGPGGAPQCGGGSLDTLQSIEDLEGTRFGDFFFGDAGPNQLLGHLGADSYFAEAGDDTILANSGDSDLVIDCGEGNDVAFVDFPQYGDPAPSGCETVYEAAPNNFRPPGTPPAPKPAAAPPRANPRDRTPPRTRILHRPPGTVYTASRRRSVTFAFASNEPASTFRCRLGRGPLRSCRSPRRYLVGLGRHTVRIAAVDAAGNIDRTPAALSFRVRRR